MFQLPVSGFNVIVRQPTGVEDLALQEPQSSSMATSLAFVERLTQSEVGERLDWRELTVTDLEAIMLWLRRTILGNTVQAETRCIHAECGARVDVTFGIEQYLASQKPRMPRGVEGRHEPGWFEFSGETVKFRLPSCGDVASIHAMTSHPVEARRELVRQCVDPPDPPARLTKRIERAMQAMAASFSGYLEGVCPECGSKLSIYLDVVSFVLKELQKHAASVYQDIHLLALYYKWPEEKILELPRQRRMHYAEMIRGERSVA